MDNGLLRFYWESNLWKSKIPRLAIKYILRFGHIIFQLKNESFKWPLKSWIFENRQCVTSKSQTFYKIYVQRDFRLCLFCDKVAGNSVLKLELVHELGSCIVKDVRYYSVLSEEDKLFIIKFSELLKIRTHMCSDFSWKSGYFGQVPLLKRQKVRRQISSKIIFITMVYFIGRNFILCSIAII